MAMLALNPELFPRRPYCGSKSACSIRSFALATKETHIQYNPPYQLRHLVFDLDFGGRNVDPMLSVEHYADVCAPPPNWIVINPQNGHAHYWYTLAEPVYRGPNASLKALAFYAAVYRGLGALLNADPQYSQLLARTPGHPAHLTLCPREDLYDLAELDEYIIDRQSGTLWKRKSKLDGLIVDDLGRNCTLFERVKSWAYQWVREYRDSGTTQDTFLAACRREATKLNDFALHPDGCLCDSEVRAIAKSVAKWTWTRYATGKMSDEAFRAVQSARGHRKGAARRDILLTKVLELATSKMPLRAIAAETGLPRSTISDWLKRAHPLG